MSTSLHSMVFSPPGSSVHGDRMRKDRAFWSILLQVSFWDWTGQGKQWSGRHSMWDSRPLLHGAELVLTCHRDGSWNPSTHGSCLEPVVNWNLSLDLGRSSFANPGTRPTEYMAHCFWPSWPEPQSTGNVSGMDVLYWFPNLRYVLLGKC